MVPHFEKMLYDNAQLVRMYLDGWRLTKDARFRQVVEETLAISFGNSRIRTEYFLRHRTRIVKEKRGGTLFGSRVKSGPSLELNLASNSAGPTESRRWET